MRIDRDVIEKKKDRDIRPVDIFRRILFSWRMIVCATIICMVAFSGLQYSKSKYDRQIRNEIEEVSLVDMLSEEEIEQVDSVLELSAWIVKRESYLENSIYMNLECDAVDKVVLVYYVSVENREEYDADMLQETITNYISSYITYVEYGGIQHELYEAVGREIEEAYLLELISAENTPSGSNEQFLITVMGESAEQAQMLATEVDRLIKGYQATVDRSVGNHMLSLVDQYSFVTMDKEVESKQADVRVQLEERKAKIKLEVAELSDIQQAVYNMGSMEAGQNILDRDDTATQSIVPAPHLSVKVALIGGVMGAFLACIWVALRVILASKLNNIDDVQKMYGIRVLGIMNKQASKKWFLPEVDSWIESILCNDKWTLEEQQELILANIRATCKRENVQNLVITSVCHFNEKEIMMINYIIQELNKNAISGDYKENIICNIDAFERSVKVGNIILVEKENMTKYNMLEKEVARCMEQEINVLGVIGIRE